MFSKQDIALLKGMFETYKKDTISEIRDETRSLIVASEARLRKGIVLDITEFIDTAILPQIAELQEDVVVLKQHVRLV
jgi:hypothetical protein